MATYNGERFVREQLDSILAQLGDHDEVVVVDDASTDSTLEVVAAVGDARIRVLPQPANIGYVAAFQTALTAARGRYLFLSDQDDIWIRGRVELMIAALQNADVVVGNCRHFGGTVTPFLRLRLRREQSTHRRRNIVGILIGYRLHWGSAMAMTASFRRLALPFPAGTTESHDQWLALAANVAGSITYLDDDVVLHRLHQRNLTPGGVRGVRLIARARLQFARELLVALRRTARLRRVAGPSLTASSLTGSSTTEPSRTEPSRTEPSTTGPADA
jgi:glycosyltransferase involved in cell wall biosynthesis